MEGSSWTHCIVGYSIQCALVANCKLSRPSACKLQKCLFWTQKLNINELSCGLNNCHMKQHMYDYFWCSYLCQVVILSMHDNSCKKILYNFLDPITFSDTWRIQMIYCIQWQKSMHTYEYHLSIYDLRFITSISSAWVEVGFADNSVQISHTLNAKLIIGWRLLFGCDEQRVQRTRDTTEEQEMKFLRWMNRTFCELVVRVWNES